MGTTPKVRTKQRGPLEDPWAKLRRKPGVTVKSEAVSDGV
jgi:hypothetical protein